MTEELHCAPVQLLSDSSTREQIAGMFLYYQFSHPGGPKVHNEIAFKAMWCSGKRKNSIMTNDGWVSEWEDGTQAGLILWGDAKC